MIETKEAFFIKVGVLLELVNHISESTKKKASLGKEVKRE